MEQRTIELLFVLLRSAICGMKLTEEECGQYVPEQLPELLKIADKHDLAHLLILGLKQNKLMSKEDRSNEKHILNAVFRYEWLQHAFDNLCNALEKEQIPFIPLKGSVIRAFYPEPWMRTSCDIDVLIHKADLEKAISGLTEKYGYEFREKGWHDVSLFAPGKIHIELHYDLVEDFFELEASNVLKRVWDMVTVKDKCTFWYEMPDDLFYLYHVTHMAKHFVSGGCGIRPFLDLWILDNLQDADKEKRDILLKRGKLLEFTNAARKLSQIWFNNAEYDQISRQIENYILRGGIYGNQANRIVLQQQKKGGRLKYLLSKVFIPYDIIKYHYPILQEYRWLLPVMEVLRWCKIIFSKHLKQTVWEIRYNNEITNDEATNVKKFLKDIGL